MHGIMGVGVAVNISMVLDKFLCKVFALFFHWFRLLRFDHRMESLATFPDYDGKNRPRDTAAAVGRHLFPFQTVSFEVLLSLLESFKMRWHLIV